MFLRLAILLLPLTSGFAAEVFQVTWPTQAASPPPRLSPEAEQLLPVFRLGLDHLPEATVVDMCLAQPLILGLTREQAATLRPLAAERYALIAKNPAYSRAPSALSYCFAPANPGHGLASVHVPDHAGPDTPVIVFIHGYGGSFLWYQHAFPREARPSFLSGGDEAFVVSGDFARRMRIVRAVCPSAQAGTIPGAGHFFMLTHREQTVTALRTWMGR